MIRRDDGNDWLLIAQPDHAHLAAEIARAWGNDAVPPLPLADLLVAAIRDHDEGWRDWEQSPEVDPATGAPRDFTEMPMPTATRIWSDSILAAAAGALSHSEALRRYQQFLDSQGIRLTRERAVALDAALSFRHPFHVDELTQVTPSVSRATIYRTCNQLVDAGVFRQRADGSLRPDVARVGSSRLGGQWVSRHFCYLAEKARENRGDDGEELAAIDEFLSEQAEHQQAWIDDSLREFAGDELNRVIETGFRYVQFFDRISLWLCCAQRTTAAAMPLPGGNEFQFIPRTPEEIAIEPYPLNVPTLVLTANARRIVARRYDDADLKQTIAAAPVERLTWRLRR